MIRRAVLAGALGAGALTGVVAVASPAAATPNQLISVPGGSRSGYLYAAAPGAQTICANTATGSTTSSVLAYNASGVYVGGVVDTTANGQAVCQSIGPAVAVEKVIGKVQKQGTSYCHKTVKAVRADPYSTVGDYFGAWIAVSSASSGCGTSSAMLGTLGESVLRTAAQFPAASALAKISNTWTPGTAGACRFSMKQPFTNKVQLRIDDGDCYRVKMTGYVDGSDQWQCKTPSSGYKTWPAVGSVMDCAVWSVRLGATNANLCYVQVDIYDVNLYFDSDLYIRGGRIV